MRTKLTIDLQHFYRHLRSQKINYEVLKVNEDFENERNAKAVLLGNFYKRITSLMPNVSYIRCNSSSLRSLTTSRRSPTASSVLPRGTK